MRSSELNRTHIRRHGISPVHDRDLPRPRAAARQRSTDDSEASGIKRRSEAAFEFSKGDGCFVAPFSVSLLFSSTFVPMPIFCRLSCQSRRRRRRRRSVKVILAAFIFVRTAEVVLFLGWFLDVVVVSAIHDFRPIVRADVSFHLATARSLREATTLLEDHLAATKKRKLAFLESLLTAASRAVRPR